MSTFLEKVGKRTKMVNRTAVHNLHPKETHKNFVEGLNQLDPESTTQKFGGSDKALKCKNSANHLSTKLNVLLWLFGDGAMAPKGTEAKNNGKQLLCGWQSLIPP